MALRGYQLQKPKKGWVERQAKKLPVKPGLLGRLFAALFSRENIPRRTIRHREHLAPAWPPSKAKS